MEKGNLGFHLNQATNINADKCAQTREHMNVLTYVPLATEYTTMRVKERRLQKYTNK